MIDLHSHILPGIDDGAGTMDDSVALARDAVNDGVRTIVATPHVREDYPTSAESMFALVSAVQAEVERAGIPLKVLPGGEIALGPLIAMDREDLRRFSLGGSNRYVLVEFPYHGWPLPLGAQIERLDGMGLRVLIAHPERSPEVQNGPERLVPLVEAGALVQLTAASVDGRLGRGPRDAARRLLQLGLAHVLASDAHMPQTREVGMSSALRELRDRELGTWLTESCPAAIVAGADLPARPRRRRTLFRR